MAARISRNNPVTVNQVLDGRKLLEIDCLDRIYLTLSVPNLVVGGQVVSFLTQHEGQPVPSPALLQRRGQTFRRAVESFAQANNIPLIAFAGKKDKRRPGMLAGTPWPERKIDQVMPLIDKAAATGRSQVVVLRGAENEHERGVEGEDVVVRKDPAGWVPGGVLVFRVPAWCSVCRDFGDGGAGGGFIDDGLVGGVGGDEGLDGEVVDGAGVAAAGLVDQGGGVVGEQGVGAAGQGEVVA